MKLSEKKIKKIIKDDVILENNAVAGYNSYDTWGDDQRTQIYNYLLDIINEGENVLVVGTNLFHLHFRESNRKIDIERTPDSIEVTTVKNPIIKQEINKDALDVALRLGGFVLEAGVLSRITDLINLVIDKGGKTSIDDVSELKTKWEYESQDKDPEGSDGSQKGTSATK